MSPGPRGPEATWFSPPTRAEIRAAVQGRGEILPRAVAFALLAESDDPKRETLLSAVVENGREPSQQRSTAAIALGHIPTAESEQLLSQALRSVPPEVVPYVLGSLGRVGTPAALDLIDSETRSRIGAVAAAARFTGALIAHRFGLPGHDLKVPSAKKLLPEPSDDGRPVEVAQASPADSQAILASLAREPYGVDLFPGPLTQLRCGTDLHTICLNRAFVGAGAVQSIIERKALLALVALQSREGYGHSVAYVVLSDPSGGDDVHLLAPRCSGRPALAGSARVIDDEILFSLRSIDRPGARAFALDGTVQRGRVKMTTATMSPTRRAAPAPAHSDRRKL